ncbi:DUF6263 family protein [Chitinophaga sp. CF418]|uniref:DUF6263 family protein n=1 Tax=Chitinophaga sp. CF418 TaxID=1855287 RepID=UPI0009165B02|nr:DUF6263 family protein [Chitinophaga sp. CF418]SHN46131.1 hypothetical protein SAMN05216311_12322 [Chitinophaga sp. CF418]
MNIKTGFLLFLGLSLTYTAFSQTQAKKNLKLTFTPGEEFDYKSSMIIDVTQAKQPMIRQELAYTLLWKVIGKDATGKTMIRAAYTSLRQKKEDRSKQETTGYDSDMPDQFIKTSNGEKEQFLNLHYRQFNDALIGQAFTIYFDESNAGIKVTGVDTITDNALDKVQIDDAEYKEGFRQGVKSMSNNEEIQKQLEAAFDYLPGKPVGIGDGWTKNKPLEMATLKLGYVVKSIQPDSMAVLLISSPVINNDYQMSVGMQGNLTIDAKTGLLIHSATRQESKSVPGSQEQVSMITTEKFELIRRKK